MVSLEVRYDANDIYIFSGEQGFVSAPPFSIQPIITCDAGYMPWKNQDVSCLVHLKVLLKVIRKVARIMELDLAL